MIVFLISYSTFLELTINVCLVRNKKKPYKITAPSRIIEFMPRILPDSLTNNVSISDCGSWWPPCESFSTSSIVRRIKTGIQTKKKLAQVKKKTPKPTLSLYFFKNLFKSLIASNKSTITRSTFLLEVLPLFYLIM